MSLCAWDIGSKTFLGSHLGHGLIYLPFVLQSIFPREFCNFASVLSCWFILQNLFLSLVQKFRGPSQVHRSSYSPVGFWGITRLFKFSWAINLKLSLGVHSCKVWFRLRATDGIIQCKRLLWRWISHWHRISCRKGDYTSLPPFLPPTQPQQQTCVIIFCGHHRCSFSYD